MNRRIRVVALVLLALALVPGLAGAAGPTPGQAAEQIRAGLTRAQLQLVNQPGEARALLTAARATYDQALDEPLSSAAPAAAQQARDGFAAAERALAAGAAPAFAGARAQVWTALLAGGYGAVERALQAGDAQTARAWLPLREFRRATRFARPNADATLAIDDVAAGRVSAADALLAMRADLLDTYQARLTEALRDLTLADQRGFAARRAEAAALAEGYFAILA